MTSKQPELSRTFEAIVGSDHVTSLPGLMIDRHKPTALVRPGSAEEVAACLRVCASAEAGVVPAGLMTWLESGNPLMRADVILSTERMSRIIEYSPPDLTVTVEAGLALNDLNRALERSGQWLPLDPPGSYKASLGAIAACASSGPLRFGFGTPRDYVIGLRLAHADGSESRSGGRVVKNVAGYDMNKLYVGSFGTLAIMTELTFKLRPLPRHTASVLVTAKDHQLLASVAETILSSQAQPSSIFLLKPAPQSLLSDERMTEALLVRFIESERAIEYQMELVSRALSPDCKATTLEPTEADRAWKQVADIDLLAEVAVRASVPLSLTAACLERLISYRSDCVAAADLGAGIIRMAFNSGEGFASRLIQSLRTEAALFGGTLFVERASTSVRGEVDAWGDPDAVAWLMKAIKEKLDPQSLLNQGRFVSGI
jgi:glycolate oxidase FAD binding subunit